VDFQASFRRVDNDVSAMAILMSLLEDSPNHEVTISKRATRDLAEYVANSKAKDQPCVVMVAEDDGMKLKLLKSHSEVSDFVDDMIED